MNDIYWFYCGSYFFLTGNDLGVMGVFPENCDKTDEEGAEISDSLRFGILCLY